MKYVTKMLSACVSAYLLAGVATAQQYGENDWMVHVGPAMLSLQDEASMSVAGQHVPGATIQTEDQSTPTVEISRYVADQFAVSLTIGLPPRAEIDGAGAFQGVGRLANVDYGPAALTMQYHPLRGKRFDPYIGAGFAYMLITNTQDGLMQNVEVENDFGAALQAGVNVSVNEKVGMFVDVKKAFLTTQAVGTVFGQDAVADVVMDPLVVSAGASVTF